MCSEGREATQSAVISASSETEEPEHQGQDKNIGDKAVVGNTSDTTIRVQRLSKCYQIYDSPRDRLKQFLVPRVQRLLGRPPQRYFREFWALKDVSFEVKKGETVGIIGRNGSGKSTLLQLICGTLAPTSGSVETTGRIAALLELGSGFNPEFTGRENVYMNGAILGLSKKEIDDRFDLIASFADIGQFIDQPVKTYSSGMAVRLAFAVQAQVDPNILVVDEALSVGDIRFQTKCFRRFDELRENGCSVLFVTHSLNQVDAFCESVIWLEGGCVQAQGKPASLTRAYTNLMIHGLSSTRDLTRQEESIEKSEAQFLHKKFNDSDDRWLTPLSCKNITNPGRIKVNRFRIRFNDESGITEIDYRPYTVTVELEVESEIEVISPLVGIGIFNNLNEAVIPVSYTHLTLPTILRV